MKQPFKFELIHQSNKSRARVGRIHTPHGIIDTPNFVGVGTNAALKGVDSAMVNSIGLQLMFCNTYHLMIQPGTDTIKKAGGLHTFINRQQPIITDSGGFQVFSLAYGSVANELKSKGKKQYEGSVIKITQDGVHFRSYRDGQKIILTPETSIQAQKDLGADIIIPFDELPPYHIDPKALKKSVARTHEWEKRSLDYHLQNPANQAMYAVIHGGLDRELRAQSCQYLTSLSFDGFAIGGSFGTLKQDMIDLVDFVTLRLPEDKPNHLLGIADLTSLDACVRLGIDTFDSAYPTRAARHGMLFTNQGALKITQSNNKNSFESIEKDCTCFTCVHYTKAYLHHLFKAKELSAYTLASIHNLHYMVQLMANYRQAIIEDRI